MTVRVFFPLPCLAEPVFKAKGAWQRLGRIWVTSFGKKTLAVLCISFKTLKCYQKFSLHSMKTYYLSNPLFGGSVH
jgi:hypothetical protein